MKRIYYSLSFLFCMTTPVVANIYQCMDSQGQRIFSDKPCSETSMGDGIVSNYEQGSLEVKKVPIVTDERAAEKIRYRMTPAQARKMYCAKYTQVERNRLIQTKQVVLGMYLADVIKVWGAPISSDGNRVLFQDAEDEIVTVSLLEGCVINLQRDYMDDDEYSYDEPVESDIY